jgi:hypothetical protein
MPTRLSDHLLGAGLVPVEAVRAAVARQAVYGGALDTAQLELEAIDDAALWGALAAATELGVPDRALCEAPQRLVKPDGSDALDLDAAWSVRCRAVPAGLKDGTLQILCGEPVGRPAIEAATGALAIPFALFVAPEIWIAAVQQAIYGRPMEPRLLRLFARLVGAQPVRRWQTAHTPPPPPMPPEPAIEIPSRQLPPPQPPLPPPSVPAPTMAAAPAATAGPTLHKAEVPALIVRLERGGDVKAAHAALVAITKQDFGTKPKRWTSWWNNHQDDDRIEWLFEGLSHKTPEIRAAAEQELRALTGEYFGYAFDLPREAREAARARWQAWWTEKGTKPKG